MRRSCASVYPLGLTQNGGSNIDASNSLELVRLVVSMVGARIVRYRHRQSPPSVRVDSLGPRQLSENSARIRRDGAGQEQTPWL